MFDRGRESGAGVFDVFAVAEKSPDAFLGLDIGALTDGGLIDAMTSARRLTSRLQAVELAAVAELVRRRAAEDVDPRVEAVAPRDYVHDEVAEALTLTAGAADDLIRFATDLTDRLPDTFTALAAGDVDCAKARTLWRGTDQIGDELAAIVETRCCPKPPARPRVRSGRRSGVWSDDWTPARSPGGARTPKDSAVCRWSTPTTTPRI
jgi:hypothetical protein